jgi:hypothetical protein
MYTKQEASQLRQQFWTSFGMYMAPLSSATGMKVSWLNYKTGEKHIYFRMHADNRSGFIGVEITHPDRSMRLLYFEQFKQLRKLLEASTGESWTWIESATDDHGKEISRIYTAITGVNIFRRETWPELISFFKPRIMALDEFWSNARYAFEALH